MTHSKLMKNGFAGLVIASALGINGALNSVLAQSDTAKTPAVQRSSEGVRDPFKKYEPPRVMPKRSGQVLPPSIEERITQYRAQKVAAMKSRLPAPKPTTALLLNEIQVIGISRSPRGYAAIVEASPIKLSYVIYPGEHFYDGQLVAIEDNRLVFRHETVFADGRRERTVEMKPLRQPSSADAMAAVKTAPANAAVAESEKQKTTATERP
jgi:hypothetical protein